MGYVGDKVNLICCSTTVIWKHTHTHTKWEIILLNYYNCKAGFRISLEEKDIY